MKAREWDLELLEERVFAHFDFVGPAPGTPSSSAHAPETPPERIHAPVSQPQHRTLPTPAMKAITHFIRAPGGNHMKHIQWAEGNQNNESRLPQNRGVMVQVAAITNLKHSRWHDDLFVREPGKVVQCESCEQSKSVTDGALQSKAESTSNFARDTWLCSACQSTL